MAAGVGMSRLALLAEEYLQTRRALGYKLTTQARIVAGFVRYLDEFGAARITVEAALGFATQPAEAQPIWWTRRLSAVRGFATYMQAIDPTTAPSSARRLIGRPVRCRRRACWPEASLGRCPTATRPRRSPR